jgi:hypothetical protein
MKRMNFKPFWSAAALLLLIVGCAPMDRLFYRPALHYTVPSHDSEARFVLASYTAPPAPGTATTATALAGTTSRPATQPTAYTAPGGAFRRLDLAIGSAALGATADTLGAGKEASESIALSSEGVLGQTGLTAPPTMMADAVVGRPGLQRGPATGLGFASPVNNIFTPRVNPASGPNGRCAELARAGFFNGDRAACERNFRK